MKELTVKQRDHITRLIQKEVEFFNGWKVDDSTLETACFKAARRVELYIFRKMKETRLIMDEAIKEANKKGD